MRDLPQMQKIYARARALMAANGNPTQWGNEFPRESMIEDDIANQRTMLLVDTCNGHERILAQFALCPGEDPTYAKIDGAWLDNDAYVTIHRIAASGLVRHAARDCIRWALKHYGNVRADTHPNNKAMQHVLEKLRLRPLRPDPAARPAGRHHQNRLSAPRVVSVAVASVFGSAVELVR